MGLGDNVNLVLLNINIQRAQGMPGEEWLLARWFCMVYAALGKQELPLRLLWSLKHANMLDIIAVLMVAFLE